MMGKAGAERQVSTHSHQDKSLPNPEKVELGGFTFSLLLTNID